MQSKKLNIPLLAVVMAVQAAYAQTAAQPAAAPASAAATAAQQQEADEAKKKEEERKKAEERAAAQRRAAEAAKSQNDTIVITGIRASLASSARSKRDADQVKDVISAEDIGKLPDANAAEAIQRVTGVQIQRDEAGEGSQFQIRGQDRNRVEIDGRSVLASNSEDRNTNFTNISSQLFSGIEVLKSPQASDVEGALGGTVRLISRKPLSSPAGLVNIRVQAQYPELRGDKVDPTVSALYSNRWNLGSAGRFGALIAISHEEYGQRTEQVAANNNWGLVTAPQYTLGAVNTYPELGQAGRRVYRPNVFRIQQYDFSRERTGIDSSLQWAPNQSLLFTLSGNYNNFESLNNEQKIAFNMNQGQQYFTPGAAADGLVQVGPNDYFLLAGRINVKPAAGTADPYDMVRINPNNTFENTEQRGVALRTDYKSDLVDVSLNLSTARGENSSLNSTANFSIPARPIGLRSAVSMDFDFRDPSRPPSFSFNLPTGYSFNDPSNWWFSNFFVSNTRRESSEDEIKLDTTWHLADEGFRDLKVGLRWAERGSSGTRQGNAASNAGGRRLVNTIPEFNGLITVMTDPIFQGYDTGLPRQWFTLVNMSNEELLALRNRVQPTAAIPDAKDYDFSLDETSLAAYVQLDFDGTVFGVPFRGNVGGRQVEYKADSLAFNVFRDGNGALLRAEEQVDVNRTSEFLPSANILFALNKSNQLRFGAAKVLAFPNPQQLVPSIILTGNSTTARSGNPQLKPFKANQLDASYEYYFGRSNVLSAAYFYKEVSASIRPAQRTGFFGDRNGDGVVNEDDRVTITFDENSFEKSRFDGVELAAQVAFDWLPGIWSGFGVGMNYTRNNAKGSVDPITGGNRPPFGLSKNSYNLILFYERNGIGFRAAYSHRDRFYSAGGNNDLITYTKDYAQLDLNANWQINKTWSVFGSVNNATNEYHQTYMVIPEATNSWRDTGRRFNLGVSANF